MKHLLVGIDFSESADRALAYAEEIALIFSSKISLLHVQKPSEDGNQRSLIDQKEYQKARERLTALADDVSSRGLNTVAIIQRGEITSTLKQIVDEGDCDLVILGCQGEHPRPDGSWGSTSAGLMEHTRIPILAVPISAPVKYPRRYVLATDEECPESLHKLSPLLRLLETDRTQLLLFHYLQATERATPDLAYGRLLEGIKYRFYYQVDDHQPNGQAVVDFADLTSADILVVLHRTGHSSTAKARESIARGITCVTTSVPVLILQDSF
ncbi:universal stress protein [Neolewinella antarctica]|uniref:Nucleotide-binding universal stress UspA family protein n=1 Tax=Neolewinella antarctica TaxID=442734 RepID=A0ABX0XDZ3_9BACT|nr:universal stress protein [Neolewinella antarctica]NJC26972.1 nucleotide-binding universal stress UspA family protein [Neolewinella antarctica]